MKRSLLLPSLLALFLIACASEAQAQSEAQIRDEGPDRHLLYTPGDVEWRPGPGSFDEGAQYAVLEGDPSEAGVFTMQIKMPTGFVISPHTHPNVERVTVLGGTLLLGSSEEVDRGAVEVLPTGTYTSMPPGMVHYAIAEGETIIQLTSVGPWKINYVNDEDDPRLSD